MAWTGIPIRIRNEEESDREARHMGTADLEDLSDVINAVSTLWGDSEGWNSVFGQFNANTGCFEVVMSGDQ